ncbi:L-dopachrome tautomerase-related protein [Sphingomonas sp.]|uniref:L-dopachrome tautomerase-related protein n=1 Tax=Sphingomonas sp. TaxID=28214 RepID=UPI003B3A6A4F
MRKRLLAWGGLGVGLAIAGGFAGSAALARVRRPLEWIADFDHQVTGVAATDDGRIFVNFPRWTDDAPISVGELMPDGGVRPYPNAEWNSWRNAKAGKMPVEKHFVCVQSIVPDRRGNLWVLDPGAPGNEKILPGAPKLVKIDLARDRVTKIIPIPEDVALQGSYLNDIRFSPDGKLGYITDSGTRGAIIVVNLASGESWRALDGHVSTQVDKSVEVRIDGKQLVRPDGRQPMFSADGIALSNDGKTLFYQALTGETLYSIATAKLRRDVSEEDRSAAVERVAQTHVADGLWLSRDEVLYLTSPTDYSITRLDGDRTETVLIDRRLRWPDTFSEGPDGRIYITASHIQDTMWFKPGAPASIRTSLFSFLPEDVSNR